MFLGGLFCFLGVVVMDFRVVGLVEALGGDAALAISGPRRVSFVGNGIVIVAIQGQGEELSIAQSLAVYQRNGREATPSRQKGKRNGRELCGSVEEMVMRGCWSVWRGPGVGCGGNDCHDNNPRAWTGTVTATDCPVILPRLSFPDTNVDRDGPPFDPTCRQPARTEPVGDHAPRRSASRRIPFCLLPFPAPPDRRVKRSRGVRCRCRIGPSARDQDSSASSMISTVICLESVGYLAI